MSMASDAPFPVAPTHGIRYGIEQVPFRTNVITKVLLLCFSREGRKGHAAYYTTCELHDGTTKLPGTCSVVSKKPELRGVGERQTTSPKHVAQKNES